MEEDPQSSLFTLPGRLDVHDAEVKLHSGASMCVIPVWHLLVIVGLVASHSAPHKITP